VCAVIYCCEYLLLLLSFRSVSALPSLLSFFLSFLLSSLQTLFFHHSLTAVWAFGGVFPIDGFSLAIQLYYVALLGSSNAPSMPVVAASSFVIATSPKTQYL